MTAATARTFDADAWDIDRVFDAKAGRSVTLCFPCRDESATIGALVTSARRHLVDEIGLVDELIVLDDRSTDETDTVAAAAGATVIHIDDIHRSHDVGHGKGNALWASLIASTGDLVVWCDGDVTSFTPDWVVRLLAPLVADDDIKLVKASYDRPVTAGGGGRATELVARPLLSLFAPGLAALAQPLSGEFAGRRDVLEAIPFVEGWGVEIAMLHALSVQAAEVMATALSRFDPGLHSVSQSLTRSDGSIVPLNLAERPPVRSLTKIRRIS